MSLQSSEVMKSLNLFQGRNIQDAVDKEYMVEYRPSEQITDASAPVIFNIPKQSRDFTDLRKCRMKMRLQIVHKDDTPLRSEEEVAFTNMIHQTAWAEVNVALNGVPISNRSSSLYPYKALFKTLMRHNEGSEDPSMRSMGWFPPYTGSSGLLGAGKPWEYAKQLCSESRVMELEGPMMEDIFESERYLVNGVAVQIKLERCSDSFIRIQPFDFAIGYETTEDIAARLKLKEDTKADWIAHPEDEEKKQRAILKSSLYYQALGASKGYKVVLKDIVMKMAYVRVFPNVIQAVQDQIQQTPALYPITRTDMKTVSIPAGQQQVYFDTLFNGPRPKKIVMAFVSSEAVNGTIGTDPLRFGHHFVSDVGIMVDGTLIQPKKLKYSDNHLSESVSTFTDYVQMVKASGYGAPNVTPEAFARQPIYTFALDPELNDALQQQIVKGSISIIVHFDRPLEKSVNIVMYAEMPGIVKIDAARNAVMN